MAKKRYFVPQMTIYSTTTTLVKLPRQVSAPTQQTCAIGNGIFLPVNEFNNYQISNLPGCAGNCVDAAQGGIQCHNANCLCSNFNGALEYISSCINAACTPSCAALSDAAALVSPFCTSVGQCFMFQVSATATFLDCSTSPTPTPLTSTNSISANSTPTPPTSSSSGNPLIGPIVGPVVGFVGVLLAVYLAYILNRHLEKNKAEDSS
jgi:hypothetical protein